jgi:4'-phosphopantetheinyl transferase
VVIIWKIELDDPLLGALQRREWLDDVELARFKSFVRPNDARNYLAAHTSLRDILARMLGCDPKDVTFQRDPLGRPSVEIGGFDFSMSHAGELCLVAISERHRVGIDVESATQPIEPGVVDLIAGPTERVTLESEPDVRQAVLSLWVAKEAVLKADGAGLTRDPRSIAVHWRARHRSGVAVDGSRPTFWGLTKLDLGSEWVAVLAIRAITGAPNIMLQTYRSRLG